ncbi:MAG TPA: glycosyltransferase [Nevskiaceae bacterium]|nr:glycosyltransferase [Nevskiaceae bacterium]
MSSAKRPDLSIVIPALNEEKRIGATLDKLAAFLKQDEFFKNKFVEIVIVSADSHDNTHQIIKSKLGLFKHAQFLKPGVPAGKGRDVQFGMLRARGEAIVFMDADLATPLRHLKQFYIARQKGADIVIGTRNIRKHHKSLVRSSIANAGNALFRIAGGVWIEDSQCGFKLFSHKAAQLCFSKLTIYKWGFDMEVLAIAKANRLRMETYRINDWHDMPHSTFDQENVITNSLHSLRDLAYIARNRLKRSYLENNNTAEE